MKEGPNHPTGTSKVCLGMRAESRVSRKNVVIMVSERERKEETEQQVVGRRGEEKTHEGK